MIFEQEIQLKDGRPCLLHNAGAADAEALLEVYCRSHEETDYLLTYPEENTHTVEQEQEHLEKMESSPNEIEIMAFVGGQAVGAAGIQCVADKEKVRHRAEFGVSVLKDFWGLGIGRALTESCIACAKEAGYAQLELGVVADNQAALALYESLGFTEYGRNPRGFRSRFTGWQELVLMRLELPSDG